MNREILFRAKRIDNGEWVYGFVVINKDKTAWIKNTDYNVNNGKTDLIPDQVHPETVGQFTGLLDKNGVRIFEGDRVKHSINQNLYDGKGTKSRVIESIVFWQQFRAVFALQMNDFCNNDLYRYVQNGGDSEVIGNIHDNK